MTGVIWSNIAYPLLGIASLNPLLAVLLSNLGVCSWAYHSGKSWGGPADMAAMRATFVGLALGAVVPWWVALFVAATVFGITWGPWYRYANHVIVALWIVFATLTGLYATTDFVMFWVGVGAFAVGGLVWLTDRQYEGLGHTLWHILTAIGTVLMVLA